MYHMTDAGEPKICRAKKKCPYGQGSVHYQSKEEARANYEETQELLAAIGAPTKWGSPGIDVALASSLSYGGTQPRWFKALPTRLGERLFGTKPELLDRIESPAGELAVVWEPDLVEDGEALMQLERGYRISKLSLRSWKTGEILGYLKTAQVSPVTAARAYGPEDGWQGMRYLAEMESFWGMEKRRGGPRQYSLEADGIEPSTYDPPKLETPEEKKEFLRTARQSLDCPDLVPYDGTDESLDRQLEQLKEAANERLAKSVAHYETPYIDYAKLSESLRGQGLGNGLYVYAARKLGEWGLPLRSSTLQTDEAVSGWTRLASDTRLPITVRNTLYEKRHVRSVSPSYYLDFSTPKE